MERWFRTMKEMWMSSLNMEDYHNIEELRESLFSFVQKYNQRGHSSLNGKSPMDRFFEESHLIIRMNDKQIEQSFLLEIERTVSNDNVVRIDEKDYEVDYRYQRQRLLLRYSPDLSRIYVVDKETNELTQIQLLDKHKNSSMHRKKVRMSEMGEKE